MSVAQAAPPSDIVYLSEKELSAATPEERASYYAWLKRALYKVDPVRWGQEVLKEEWWSKQEEIARSVATNRKTAVRACHDSGKSFIAARMACWWLETGTPGKRFVVSTAPTGDLVKAILWREINQAHKKGNLRGRTNLTEWYIDGGIVAMGRKPNDYQPNNFVGIHAEEGVLIIYDEAGGIPAGFYAAGQSMAANTVSRELAIGNPDDPGSHFEKLFHPELGWNPIHIDAFETPNFTGEHVAPEVATSLIDHIYEADMRAEHGVTSPIYIAKVRGNFPKDRSDGMIPFSWIQACRLERDLNPTGDVQLGIDVGGSSSGDETVVRERIGMTVGRRWGWRYDDPMHSVGDIVNVIKETGATSVKIDSIGVGHGVWGRLREVCEEDPDINCEVIGVGVGESAPDKANYVNLKAQIWWQVGRLLTRDRVWNLYNLDDKTVTELAEHRFTRDSAGRIKVESKDKVKERIDRSPDDADALLLAFYEPPSKAPVFLGAA